MGNISNLGQYVKFYGIFLKVTGIVNQRMH